MQLEQTKKEIKKLCKELNRQNPHASYLLDIQALNGLTYGKVKNFYGSKSERIATINFLINEIKQARKEKKAFAFCFEVSTFESDQVRHAHALSYQDLNELNEATPEALAYYEPASVWVKDIEPIA